MTDPSQVYGKPWSKSQNAFVDNTLVQGDNVVQCQRFRNTIAEINAGKTLLAAVADKKYRIIDWTFIAYGGAAAAATAVTLLATQSSAVALATIAVGGLSQSAVVKPDHTNCAVLADGASFIANDEETAITIGKTGGSDLATCTGIDVILTYTLEDA